MNSLKVHAFVGVIVIVMFSVAVSCGATFGVQDVAVKSYDIDQCSDLDQAIQAGNFYFVGPYIEGRYGKSQTIETEEISSEIQLLNFTTAKMMTPKMRDELSQLFPWSIEDELREIKRRGFLSMGEVIEFMEQNGYRPATLLETLALAAKHPSLQIENHIIALGTSWYHEDDGRISTVELLASHEGGRNVLARTIDSGWDQGTLFAAIKISK